MSDTSPIENVLSLTQLAVGATTAEFLLTSNDPSCAEVRVTVGESLATATPHQRMAVSVTGPSAEHGSVAVVVPVGHDAEVVERALNVAAALVEEQLDRSLEQHHLDGLGITLRHHYDELCQARDELAARNSDLALRVATDGLTGLPNREGIHEVLDRLSENAGPPVVLMIDLDGFKAVNDEHGHSVGDGLLQAVGDRLQRFVGTSDVAGRLGGDEFVVVLAGPITEAEASRRADDLWQVLRSRYKIRDLHLTIDVSIGVALHSPHMTVDQTIAAADMRMYRHKERNYATSERSIDRVMPYVRPGDSATRR